MFRLSATRPKWERALEFGDSKGEVLGIAMDIGGE